MSSERLSLKYFKEIMGLVWFAIYLLNDFRNVTRSARATASGALRRAKRAWELAKRARQRSLPDRLAT